MKLKQLESFFEGHPLAKKGYKLKQSDSRLGRCVMLTDKRDQFLTSPMDYARMDAFLDGYNFKLNEIGTPKDDKKSNGGRVPDYVNYGVWVRKNDPIAFQVGFREWEI